MSSSTPYPITLLMTSAAAGDPQAADALLPLLYDELRRLARARLEHERPGQTLQATALVHEAYLRLLGPEGEAQPWQSRGHFFAAAAEAMRRILIDRARARGAAKRVGPGVRRLTLDPDLVRLDEPPDGLLELHEALSRFEQVEPDKAMLVKLRFFGGLSLREAAAALGLPQSTADRHWAYARAWLFELLSADAATPAPRKT